MRGFAVDEFGATGSVRDLPEPALQEGDVRVRVRAAGVNPLDYAIATGAIHRRVKEAMRGRFPLVLGMDLSGTVEGVGPGVDTVAVGDEVYGLPGKPFFGGGSFAELAVVSALTIAPKPASLPHAEAAAVPMAAMTAVAAMDIARPGPGDTALIVRAAGGVGSFAVQMAAARGARVIAVARGVNADYLRSLGAAEVIDYERADPIDATRALCPGGADVLIDLLGGRGGLERLLDAVRDGGRVACVTAVPEELVSARGIAAETIVADASSARLSDVARLLDAGALRLPEIRAFPLERAAEALYECGQRHVRGKLVLTVA